jgi:hypothetical protein
LKLKDYHRFVGIDLDLQGRVWLATDPKGVLIYDPSNQSLNTPFPADSVIQHDVSDANSIIYCDRDGIIWLGNWDRKGFYQLIPYSPAVTLYTPNPKGPLGFFGNLVVSVTKAKGGMLWLGTGQGLYEFNKQTGELKALNNKDFPGLKVNSMIVPDWTDPHLNIMRIETDAGYFEMDMNTQNCRPVVFNDSLGKPFNLEAPGFLFPLKNSWLIIGPYKDKLFLFTGKGDDVTPREAASIPNNNFIDIATDHDHLVFVKQDETAGNLTYSYVDGKLLRIPNKLDSIQWTSIFLIRKTVLIGWRLQSKSFITIIILK